MIAVLGRYAPILRAPHVKALLGFSVPAQLPTGAAALALVIFVHQYTGSFATAGLVAGGFGLATGVCGPLVGRLADRFGPSPVLTAAALVHLPAMLLVVILGTNGAPTVALVAAAALAGAALPPIAPSRRAMWPKLLIGRDEPMLRAYALDTLMFEAVFIVGPLLTALLVTVASAAAAIVAISVIAAAGTIAFAANPAARAAERRSHSGERFGALSSMGVLTLTVAAVPIGFCFGSLEVSLPAVADEHGVPALAGLMLAMLSIGSVVGGLVFGAFGHQLKAIPRYISLSFAVPLSLALVAATPGLWAMLIVLPISGCIVAPLAATRMELVSGLAPRGAAVEAFTWTLTATVFGEASGTALGGWMIHQSSWRTAVLGATALGLAGWAMAVLARGTLRTRET